MSAARKVFHCAVDDSVLTTNISEIKRWASNGAITLFVPLYTLERLQAPKRGGSQVAINSREAVRFLDRVTSGKDSIPADRVVLQGPMEQYDNWADAEQFFLPEFEEDVDEYAAPSDGDIITPKFENAKANGNQAKSEPQQKGPGLPGLSSDLSQMLLSKLNFKSPAVVGSQNDVKSPVSLPSVGTQSDEGSRASSRSSQTSPEYADPNAKRGHNRSTSTASTTPPAPATLQPLLSALLWRLHHDEGSAGVPQNLTLISNDRDTQVWAQKFGIMTKNIHQLRTAIQYEEKEFRNRVKYAEKTQHVAPSPKPLFAYENDSDEDELVFVPRGGRGKGAGRGNGSRTTNGRKTRAATAAAIAQADTTVEVPSQPIDPDSFSRSIGATTIVKQPPLDLSSQLGASRGLAAASRRIGDDHGHGHGQANGVNGGSSRRRQRGAGSTRANTSTRGGRGQGKLWVP